MDARQKRKSAGSTLSLAGRTGVAAATCCVRTHLSASRLGSFRQSPSGEQVHRPGAPGLVVESILVDGEEVARLPERTVRRGAEPAAAVVQRRDVLVAVDDRELHRPSPSDAAYATRRLPNSSMPLDWRGSNSAMSVVPIHAARTRRDRQHGTESPFRSGPPVVERGVWSGQRGLAQHLVEPCRGGWVRLRTGARY
jgi:hypothetical protein